MIWLSLWEDWKLQSEFIKFFTIPCNILGHLNALLDTLIVEDCRIYLRDLWDIWKYFLWTFPGIGERNLAAMEGRERWWSEKDTASNTCWQPFRMWKYEKNNNVDISISTWQKEENGRPLTATEQWTFESVEPNKSFHKCVQRILK